MYEAFYGFTAKPFQLNPDPRFYFGSRQHRRAMAFMEYGLHQGEGFIVVTGEVGAGKTTLVANLLAKLDPGRVAAANIVSTHLEADDTLRMVAAAFGLPTRGLPKSELLLSVEALLASHTSQGKRCLLVVDEAQNLSPRAVEELRMLSNFQLDTHALLQTFLVGQPEFRGILQSPQMNQLRQRVIAACHVGPLDADDTRRYIEHRLGQVGWNGVPEIKPAAFEAVHLASGGIPRRINLVCDRVLLSGFISGKPLFTAEAVQEIAAEINAEVTAPAPLQRRISDLDSRLYAPLPRNAYPDAPDSEAALAARGPSHAANAADPDDLQSAYEEMREFKAALLRIERGNQATLGLFRRFLDWVRTEQAGRGND